MALSALEFFGVFHRELGVGKAKLWGLTVQGRHSVEEVLRPDFARGHDPSGRAMLQRCKGVEAYVCGDGILAEELGDLRCFACGPRGDRLSPCEMFEVGAKEVFIVRPYRLITSARKALLLKILSASRMVLGRPHRA